ncbi:uncharacterized protein LOC128615942 [Ictalurus furcatus]|uniref:uncharacterized protein LOC128615942 n=1 Tax=Ictalurus furcatus TaxID=66913 RepID=UPI00235034A7|nr:uncharacterized protein LOC128615942 [Ictalurus furcatus]XP_053494330.1 uncharacterized protein LOC128615942 [Ictalurus furcatus]XP_053494331.1 uncharacterized protein LOC128615942 [Ictalurus furcatus]
MQSVTFLTVTILLTVNAGADQMTLSTLQSMNAVCGETVRLPCSIDKNVTVMGYYWTDGNKTICDYKATVKGESQHISCEYTDNQSLVLTIEYVLPSNSGHYHCFLLAKSGHTSNTTTLQVSDCSEQVIAEQRNQNWKQPLNHACASENKWINLLVSLTALVSLILDLGI